MEEYLWIVYPYISLFMLVVGLFFRYHYGQLGWGSRSSELLEKRLLKTGSLLFHYGILAVFGGHFLGLIVPLSFYHWIGVPDEFYHHILADGAGGLAGVVTWIGVVLLLIRRLGNKRVRRNSSTPDLVALIMLFIVITLGDAMTIGYNNIIGSYEYRTTVGPWFRSLFTMSPDASLMRDVPLLLKIHIISTFTLIGISPFTRLIHFWSVPVRYPIRRPLQYRSRTQYGRR
ncbi:MAG TPA: respiratory nitrate reductase subunit gamma [Bacillales bacterium]|nr:respiratory nitrate reductase subunit gamma [Bacillales bacterium]